MQNKTNAQQKYSVPAEFSQYFYLNKKAVPPKPSRAKKNHTVI